MVFPESGQTPRSVTVSLSTGSAFSTASLAHDDFCAGSDECHAADVNGDGKADLLALVTATAGSYTEGEAHAALRQPCSIFDTVGTSCEDGLWCNGAEECNSSHQCVAATNPTDDGNPCTLDFCDEQTQSVWHASVNPDDGNSCTVDSCDPVNGVQNVPLPDDEVCTTGNPCDGPATCRGGWCAGSGFGGGDPCLVYSCDPVLGMSAEPATDGTTCVWGGSCSGGAECQSGQCVTLPDPAPPTGYECFECRDAREGPEYTDPKPSGSPCDDGNPCTINECDGSGVCGATPVASGTVCSDGNPCNGVELCNGSGTCQTGTAPDVDDGNPCTADSCDAFLGVLNTPLARGAQPSGCDSAMECDGAGRCDEPAESAPEPVPTPLDPTAATWITDATAFLYAGQDPIQAKPAGASIDPLDPKRVTVLRGRVLGRDCTAPATCISMSGAELPLPGVVVSILGKKDSWGQTLTRDDGWFDLAVEGGAPLTVTFEREGYLAAQRTIKVLPWNEYVPLDDVILVKPSSTFADVTLNPSSSGPGQMVTGPLVSEGPSASDRERRGRLFIPDGVAATVETGSGSSQPSQIRIRITEYTQWSEGAATNSMPGDLPTSSGYTYAVELGVDGADSVEFHDGETEPTPVAIPFYVDNFLGFRVGANVPLGYYDKEAGYWKAAESGRVIRIAAITNGRAELDLDSGLPGGDLDPDTLPSELGFTDEELDALGDTYSVGDELWRARMTHFTPWDLNWPYGPPRCDDGGPCYNDDNGTATGPDPDPDCSSTKSGSIIECESQTLGETLPLAGTDQSLHYRSSRTPGDASRRTVTFRLPSTPKHARMWFEAQLPRASRGGRARSGHVGRARDLGEASCASAQRVGATRRRGNGAGALRGAGLRRAGGKVDGEGSGAIRGGWAELVSIRAGGSGQPHRCRWTAGRTTHAHSVVGVGGSFLESDYGAGCAVRRGSVVDDGGYAA